MRETEDREAGSGAGPAQRNGSVPDAALVEQAKEQLSRMTGKQAVSVSALVRTDDGWRITVELIELDRVPDSTSILGTYETEIDDRGNLVGYERTRRYHRSESDD